MLVREVMTSAVVVVSAETSIKEAVTLLARHRITAMPVVDDDGELVGVVSEADVLLEAFLPDQQAHEFPVQITAGPAVSRVSEVMSRHVLAVSANADVAEAADLMRSTMVKSLPVVEHNRVVGILSRCDLVAQLDGRDGEIEARVDDLIRTAGYDWTVEVVDRVVTVDGPGAKREVGIATTLVGTVPGVVGVYIPNSQVG